MSRDELLASVKNRMIYIPGEDYYDKSTITAKVVFCGIDYVSTVMVEPSLSIDYTRNMACANIMANINKWLDKKEIEEQERRLKSQPYEELDNERLQEYLNNL
jgi:hypothetical protein